MITIIAAAAIAAGILITIHKHRRASPAGSKVSRKSFWGMPDIFNEAQFDD